MLAILLASTAAAFAGAGVPGSSLVTTLIVLDAIGSLARRRRHRARRRGGSAARHVSFLVNTMSNLSEQAGSRRVSESATPAQQAFQRRSCNLHRDICSPPRALKPDNDSACVVSRCLFPMIAPTRPDHDAEHRMWRSLEITTRLAGKLRITRMARIACRERFVPFA